MLETKADWELPGDDGAREPKMSLLSLRVTACPAASHRVSSAAKGERAGDAVRQCRCEDIQLHKGQSDQEKGMGTRKLQKTQPNAYCRLEHKRFHK